VAGDSHLTGTTGELGGLGPGNHATPGDVTPPGHGPTPGDALTPGNDIAELKQYAVAHLRAQKVRAARAGELLDRIRTDDGAGDGSWVGEWCRRGEEAERAGDLFTAYQHYNMARFPFADGPAREKAARRCVDTFDRWRREAGGIERLEIELPGGRVPCWTSGLSTTRRLPLLVVTGGIISTKEQWAPLLRAAGRLGMAGIAAEMPGVGENSTPYDAGSWRMFPAILDAVADRARVEETYTLALSFSGHLALRAAVHDRRIRGIVTAAAPVREFFTDTAWHRQLPKVTLDTLDHLLRTAPGAGRGIDGTADWGLTDDELTGLGIPLAYVATLRDEVIPQADMALLKRLVRDLDMIEFDDVHGSPNHALHTRLWSTHRLLRMRGVRSPVRAALACALLVQRARARVHTEQ
jgi:esterase FrsA